MPTIEEIKKLIDYSVDVKHVREVCERHLLDKDLQPGSPRWNGETTYPDKSPMTFCTFYAPRVLEELGFDCTPLYHDYGVVWKLNYYWNDAITMFDNAVKGSQGLYAETGIREVTREQAFHLAHFGVPCFIASREYVGHVAVAIDEPDLVANAGSAAVMGIKPIADIFYKYNLKPRFFQLRKKP